VIPILRLVRVGWSSRKLSVPRWFDATTLGMDILLLKPLDEELQELQDWVASIPPTGVAWTTIRPGGSPRPPAVGLPPQWPTRAMDRFGLRFALFRRFLTFFAPVAADADSAVV